METLERMPFKAQMAIFDKLLNVAEVGRMNDEDRAIYDKVLMAYRDYHNAIASAERLSREAGKAEGIAEGIMEGEATKQRQIAIKLKAQGINIETIAQCTDLTIDEIKRL